MVPPAKISFVTSRNRDDVGTRVEAVIGSSLTLPIQIRSAAGEIRMLGGHRYVCTVGPLY